MFIAVSLPVVGSSPLTRGKLPGGGPGSRGRRLIPAHAGKTAHSRSGRPRDRAHPRSRGENERGALRLLDWAGSSPLTRGKLVVLQVAEGERGLIPAHAGKTLTMTFRLDRLGAHPRSRGENAASMLVGCQALGSSPLTRGKPQHIPGDRLRDGLIPAHAGKTSYSRSRRVFLWAHPRSRGENPRSYPKMPRDRGSSPLTRGKPQHVPGDRLSDGLIPAHAGKTRLWSGATRTWPAHPRSRGENVRPKPASVYLVGSSPLTRGKLVQREREARLPGLIPAHAGKTCSSSLRGLGKRAHPRSRGENLARPDRSEQLVGSSPLTRGKHTQELPNLLDDRLIPAHAGKTDVTRARCCITGAHPRSRGENEIEALLDPEQQGSSPLTRGKHPLASVHPYLTGLIPAHAGKTADLERNPELEGAHPRSRGENSGMRSVEMIIEGSSPLTRGKRRRGVVRLRRSGLIPAHAGKTGHLGLVVDNGQAHPRSRGENARATTTIVDASGSSPLTRGKHQPEGQRLRAHGLIPAHAGKTREVCHTQDTGGAHPRSRGENRGA